MANNHHQILLRITVKSPKIGELLRKLQQDMSVYCAAQSRSDGLHAQVSGVLA